MSVRVNIEKNARMLVVVAHLAQERPAWLYRVIEWLGIVTANIVLKHHYHRVVVLRAEHATRKIFQDTIDHAGFDTAIKAIDVIINTHGSEYDFTLAPNERLQPRQLAFSVAAQQKLRLLYSTACYGALGNGWWLQHGFATAIGAQGLNINAFPEYYLFLSAWAGGHDAGNALARASGWLSRMPDKIGRLFNKNVDSTKQIAGRTDIAIFSV